MVVGTIVGSTAVLTAAVIGSNSVGWAAVGVATASTVVGVGITLGFNYLYDNNLFGIQDGLNWAGQQIDQGLKIVYETTSNFFEDVGEAFFNWA
ncbi:hypothetical protein [Oceanobacillus iheyensis]|uniref:hypothetical protein n=1 Tax=Oceanobacillus iheyensis TaxID=182710 RepID=UPI0000167FC0|nr:hypothetical protein [Oceanobacillus iheyensis]